MRTQISSIYHLLFTHSSYIGVISLVRCAGDNNKFLLAHTREEWDIADVSIHKDDGEKKALFTEREKI